MPRRPFPRLCSSFLCAYCSKKLPERVPTKTQLRVLSIIDQLRAWAHRRSAYAQLRPLYPSLYPYVTHVINYSRPSTAFPYCKRRKAGWGLGTRLVTTMKTIVFQDTMMQLHVPHCPKQAPMSTHSSSIKIVCGHLHRECASMVQPFPCNRPPSTYEVKVTCYYICCFAHALTCCTAIEYLRM